MWTWVSTQPNRRKGHPVFIIFLYNLYIMLFVYFCQFCDVSSLYFSRAVVDHDAPGGGAAEAAQVSQLSPPADAPPRDEPHASAARAGTPDCHRIFGGKYFTTKSLFSADKLCGAVGLQKNSRFRALWLLYRPRIESFGRSTATPCNEPATSLFNN